MSDSSLNELHTKLIKLDKADEQSDKSPSSLNIITSIKKSNQGSIFIVPGQSSTNLTTVTLLNDNASPPSNSKQILASTTPNKITIIPFNGSNQKPSTPINLSSSPGQQHLHKTTIISNAKNLIQLNSTSNSTNSTTGINTNTIQSSPIRAGNILASLERSPQATTTNTKIFTISTQGPSSNSTQSGSCINNLTSNALHTINASGASNNPGNKIQYVKIVNTPKDPQLCLSKQTRATFQTQQPLR